MTQTANSSSNLGTTDLVLSDAGNAFIFADHHGQDVRYNCTTGRWLLWDGARWQDDITGQILQKAKQTAARLWNHATTFPDDDRRQVLKRHARGTQSEGRLKAMVNLAKSEPGIPITEPQLDVDPWLLNVINGTIELRTGQLLPHRHENLITKLAPVEYNPTARCPVWDQFLVDVMGGDTATIQFLQKAIGYSLSGSTREQKLFLLHGSGGNGKSTFLNVIHRMLGDYALTTPTDTLLVKKTNGIPNDVARLKGARFVSAVEADIDKHLAEALLKRLTGSDPISARFLYGEFFDFLPSFKLFLAVNHKPTIKGNDHAIWRRIFLIPFEVQIPADKIDRDIERKLEQEFPGILRWAVEGCLLWQREGLEPPESVAIATNDYRSEMDAVGEFIKDCCEVDSAAKTPFKDLFAAYIIWCDENIYGRPERNDFARELTQKGFAKAKSRAMGWYRYGIRLKPAGDNEDSSDNQIDTSVLI
jgi:putative DNA primase/helicase